MHTGSTVTDTTGRTWKVGQRLGRGTWGSTWVVRDADGRELALKVPLGEKDFPSDAPVPPELLAACRAQLTEQTALLRDGSLPFLPRLEAELEIDGAPAMLLPRYTSTLERRLQAGAPLGEIMDLLLQVTELLTRLQGSGRVHGNLRPSNVLLNDRGEPVLSDLLTPAGHDAWRRLVDLTPDRRGYRPPEAQGAPSPGWDAWAVCVTLYKAAVLQPSGVQPSGEIRREDRSELPSALDKVQLATLRDRALARLQAESANPRFETRVAERLASLLNRGICVQTQPSPPYRFESAKALAPRLREVASMVHPAVESVGRVLLAPNASDGIFRGGETATFSVTVGTSTDAAGHEDIACGVKLFDLDADGDRLPVPETRYTVRPHPSGRLRFDFQLPGVPPGRYRIAVAFTIRDGAQEPQVSAGEFEIRPPPGYVPPAPEPTSGPTPLTFPSPDPSPGRDAPPPEARPEPIGATGRSTAGTATASDTASASFDGLPRPLSPSSAGVPSSAGDAPSSPYGEFPSSPGIAPSQPGLGELPPPPVPVPVEIEPTRADTGAEPGDDVSDPGPRPPALDVRPQIRPAPTPVAVADRAPYDEDPATVASNEPPPAWSGPGQWEELPGPDAPDPHALADLDPDDPHYGDVDDGEDLPDWGDISRPGASEWIERAIAFAQRDTYTAFLIGLGGVLLVVLLLVTGFKACS